MRWVRERGKGMVLHNDYLRPELEVKIVFINMRVSSQKDIPLH